MSEDIVRRLQERGTMLDHDADDVIWNQKNEIERLRAELASANAQLDEAGEQIDVERYERDALRAQLAEAREALEPFAKMESSWDASKFNWMEVERYVTIGDMRRARAVLEKIKGGRDE